MSANHPDTAGCLNNLAEFYRALVIKEQALAATHPGIAPLPDTLAELYTARGKPVV